LGGPSDGKKNKIGGRKKLGKRGVSVLWFLKMVNSSLAGTRKKRKK